MHVTVTLLHTLTYITCIVYGVLLRISHVLYKTSYRQQTLLSYMLIWFPCVPKIPSVVTISSQGCTKWSHVKFPLLPSWGRIRLNVWRRATFGQHAAFQAPSQISRRKRLRVGHVSSCSFARSFVRLSVNPHIANKSTSIGRFFREILHCEFLRNFIGIKIFVKNLTKVTYFTGNPTYIYGYLCHQGYYSSLFF